MDLAARCSLAEAVLADTDLPTRVVDRLTASSSCADATGPATRASLLLSVHHHGEFFAGALQAGSPALFADYVQWCAAHRRARGRDVDELRRQLELLGDQLPYRREQRDLVERTLAAGLGALAVDAPAPTPDDRAPLRLAYLSAALAGDRRRAWEAVERCRETMPLMDVYQDVLLGAQRRLGTLWQDAQISVAQEHMASAVTQSILARLYAAIDVPRGRGRAMMAGPEMERHSLPAQFAADMLELDGWDVAFVGTDCSPQSLLAALETERPDVLGLSVTLASHLPQAVRVVLAVQAQFSTLPVVLGGYAATRAPELAAELHVAAPLADPREAFRPFARSVSGTVASPTRKEGGHGPKRREP